MVDLKRSFFTILMVFLSAQGGTSAAFGAQNIQTIAEHAILIEGATGDVLFAKEPDTPMAPSSMTKTLPG